MKIQEIYEKYYILPNLQLHMLHVASVAAFICDSVKIPINKDFIIGAGLLHDLGNIVKFDFEHFSKTWFLPQGVDYWKDVYREFTKKYGSDDHKVTIKILKEIGVLQDVINLIDQIGFSESEKISGSSNYNLKILSYADQRVSPYGVVSMEARYKEAWKRYAGKIDKKYTIEKFEFLKKKNYENEKQIFSHCIIKSEDITEEKVKPFIEKLRSFEIKVD